MGPSLNSGRERERERERKRKRERDDRRHTYHAHCVHAIVAATHSASRERGEERPPMPIRPSIRLSICPRERAEPRSAESSPLRSARMRALRPARIRDLRPARVTLIAAGARRQGGLRGTAACHLGVGRRAPLSFPYYLDKVEVLDFDRLQKRAGEVAGYITGGWPKGDNQEHQQEESDGKGTLATSHGMCHASSVKAIQLFYPSPSTLSPLAPTRTSTHICKCTKNSSCSE